MQVSCFLHYDKNDSGKSRSLSCFGLEEAVKIDRLIGILSILLQKDTVTAPELAERFEVPLTVAGSFSFCIMRQRERAGGSSSLII